ncbi:hypothetical protein HYH03_006664 [Edaphochlamys debaryana]|uniref:Uncharacterized protein n=1 Tax=Edaphochlamys debaryana TaxID=47281 RepID=A0A835Y5B3_9CHLO|nr:hypothetical protein HYH03_006664 [Edaphochlamys debaryana]|eukprot:KAG2495397.1 hypothetical protein HYH03_006664 [Edaphochlamys debaryana]
MFHAMTRRTADWWPLTFDISRSQSGLRVTTTAAPVTASELEQSLAETMAGDVVEEAAQRGEQERRDRLQAIMSPAPPQASGLGNHYGVTGWCPASMLSGLWSQLRSGVEMYKAWQLSWRG